MSEEKDDDLSNAPLEFEKVQPIAYQNAYVAFIDILGFSQIVLSNDIGKISLYHLIVKKVVHQKLEMPLELAGKFNIQVMSDSIVLAVSPNNNLADHIKCIQGLALAVGALQFELAINNLWARGGITFGPIAFLEKNFVVGPALVNSYVLEKEKAKFPRVIIDPLIPNILKMDENQFIEKVTPNPQAFRPLILGKDPKSNIYFNDYSIVNFFNFFEQDWAFAAQAAEKISHHLKNNLSLKNEHIEKYLWVARYIKSLRMPEKVIVHFEWLDEMEFE